VYVNRDGGVESDYHCRKDSRETMSNTRKLASLRARTAQELLVLMQRELNRALTQADVAEAEKAYDKAVTLLRSVPERAPVRSCSDRGRSEVMRVFTVELRLIGAQLITRR
jgi:hypothetical protein